MPNLDASRFLEDLTGRYARSYTDLIGEMLLAKARDNRPKLASVRDRLAGVIAETMGIAEVLSATLVLQRAAGLIDANLRAQVVFRETGVQTILPRVTLTEAIEDMVERVPTTIRNAAERTAQNIAKLYTKDHVMAFVRSAEQAVTERVQSLIAEAAREGLGEAAAGRLIRMGVDEVRERTSAWTEGYARMAFRPNITTATSAGRFRQARDPDIAAVIPAVRFDAVGDADTRHNHNAANGVILLTTNTAWRFLAPPLGYNCRCQVALVSLPDLMRMGRVNRNTNEIIESRVPTTARADPGFRHGGRPDLFL